MIISFVNHGVANRFDSYIEINRDLIWQPKLMHYCLKHELEHTDKPFSVTDYRLDMFMPLKIQIQLFFFMLIHPKSWMQLLPCYPSRNRWYWDLNLLTMYAGIILIITILLRL